MERVGTSKRETAIPKDSGLTELIFSWSLDDIHDENLYTNQVQRIPDIFSTVDHYFGSYTYPLLEEIRAEMCSSMEVIHSAPFAEVISFDESKPYAMLLYNVKVDHWRNRFSDRGKEPYKTLPGDILVLTDVKPESVSDLQRAGRIWTFALVTKISEDEENEESVDNSTSTYFKVKLSKEYEVIHQKQRSMFVVFLINITTSKRIWNALHFLGNMSIISEVLSSDSVLKENCCYCPVWSDGVYAKASGMSSSSDLNQSQTKAVLACLGKIQCYHKSSVELIWGPPGTGKTKTVSVLLYNLLKKNCRTLTCAPTNVAITEVAYRVVKLVKESSENGLGANSLFCSLGDILIFGNKDRLKVGSDIVGVYLDYRIDRLVECFGPLTGWRHCFTSMIDYLENCVSDYQIFLENESIKEKNCSSECETTMEEDKSFLKFARDRFKFAAAPLRGCVRILCTHLPKSFLLEQNFENMVGLVQLLNSFESFLFNNNVVPEELEQLFSHQEVVQNSSLSFSDSSFFPSIHRRLCSVLKALRSSLNELKLPSVMNSDSIKVFCFQMASLIFCTASSSYKLHSVNMKPLDLLVIDEAAQLKECESTIPLQLPDIRHAILIGDECQLPAMVTSKVSEEAGFGRSLFERLSSLDHSKHLLDVQYRMHPSISFFPNSKFYLNQILDAPNVKSTIYNKHYLSGPMFGSYSFINVFGGKEERDDVGKSLKSMIEVAIVVKIIRNLHKEWSGSNQKLSIGVISPYAAQVVAIQDQLGRKYENLDNFSVKVKTVDGFQGGEEDIIIISTVRSNSRGSIGFLDNPQRTNVALTRARHCLWVLGNERTLANSESVWEDLVHDAKHRNCFFNADEDKDMAKAILEIKTEFDQLDHLLDGNSVLFKSSRWKVLFSDNFRKSFVKLRSERMKKSVMNLLLKLSSGWRPKWLKVDRVCESSSQILKQFKVEGLYVVCSIDIDKHNSTQVLKVWDILPVEDIPKLVKRLDNIFQMYSDDYINRCKEKCFDGKLEVPKTWASSSDIVQYKNCCDNESKDNESTSASDGRSYVENSKVSESLLLMKFYSLSSGVVSHLLSHHDGRELDLPFEVTEQEQDIILFCRSTFILGRSGTGKTTVLTMKLFQKEQQHHLAMEGFQEDKGNASINAMHRNEAGTSARETEAAVLRQLFVTVSPKLCYAVKRHVSHLKSFAHGTKLSAENNSNNMDYVDDAELFNDIQDSLIDNPPKSYPLVVTFHKFLMMLDGTLGNSYFERFHDAQELSHGKRTSLSSISMQTLIRTKEVTYDRFTSSYWPHFNSQLTKKLDSSRVFTEIISHIKGGLREGRVPDGKLSLEDYVQLSEGRTSTLNRQKREIIYDIFQDYEKMKMEKGEFDLADLVIDLHRRLRQEKYVGDQMDFVYIDEVQDLTMRQIALFKYVCRNVNEGFVFSGDTAQTIARGVDFRFQDIRSLFYNEFIMESSGGCDARKEKGQISEIFHLSQNFRTHAGVLKLSQSVIDLLYRFFPQSIDILSPETSHIYGEAPVLLESGDDENAIITMFGNSQNTSGDMVGFGAEQVILVRDDCARKEISDYVGKQALVLTILECKGLEFQDVLLYNFFGSSPLKNRWRVIYHYMKEQDLLDSSSNWSPPSFNPAKHNVLCSELKQLYVAITRTRQRLWICENNKELSKPMFDYWKKLCLVQVTQLDASLANEMRVASSPEEWKAMGIKLLQEHHYEMATRYFERAGDTYWARLAKAHGLKAAAEQKRDLNPEAACVDLRKAAEIFEEIGEARTAAKCFFELHEYERAGRIYLEKCGELELKKAGECFSLGGFYELAAEVYAKGHFFSDCLSACTEGELFDMGLQYIQYWKQHSTTSNGMPKRTKEIEKIEQDFLESCACHYHRLKDKRMMMEFVKAFHSMESKRKFLKTLDCLDELLRLEEESGNFLEAADIAKLGGEILVEAEMLGKAGNYKDASSLLLCHVFSNSLWASGSGGWPLKQFSEKEELLVKAKSLAERESNHFYEFVCLEASSLSSEKTSLFELNQCLTMSQSQENVRAAILCARKIIDVHFSTNTSKYVWADEWVSDLKQHAEDRISQNCISIETLMYFWNVWKEKIVDIFEYLGHVKTQEVKEYASIGDFCLNYLGVRKQGKNLNLIYTLLNPDANWVKEINARFIKRTGKLVYVDAHQFASAARSYWSSELLSVGKKILEILSFYSTGRLLSLFCQIKLLIHMFEVTNFLLELKFLDRSFHTCKALQKYLDLSVEQFCFKVFPLDSKRSSTENMVTLRETEVYRNLLRVVISRSIITKSRLTYAQIGRLVSWILGTGKLTTELYGKIAESIEVDSAWRAFIENLSDYRRSEIPQGSGPTNSSGTQKHLSLILMLDGALRDTYNVNWRTISDYISPDNFLYLFERLSLFVTSFRGYCFTTRSSYIEWLIFREWDGNLHPGLVANQPFPFGGTVSFVANVATQLLNCKRDTKDWIRNANINLKEFYPVLVLRLFIILCLLYVNTGKYLEVVLRLLTDMEITSQLRKDFCDTLRRRKNIDVNVLAEEFKKIGNPLVILELPGNSTKLYCPDAIFIDTRFNKSREELLQALFQRSIILSSSKLPSNNDTPSNLASPADQNLKSQKDDVTVGDTQNNYKHFWAFLDALDGGFKDFLPKVARVKVVIENNIGLITKVVATFQKNPPEGEDIKLHQELNSMLDELKQLSSALNVSKEKIEKRRVEELFTGLKSRRRVVEPFLKQLFSKDESTAAASLASTTTNTMAIDIQNQVEKGKAEEVGEEGEVDAIASETSGASSKTPTTSGSNKQHTESSKGKANSKGKKGKKGKGRKK